jgi:hypothetical protein
MRVAEPGRALSMCALPLLPKLGPLLDQSVDEGALAWLAAK